MRRILVDRARRKSNQRNGGGFRRTELDPASLDGKSEHADTSILIDELLELLNRSHPEKTSIVELRFFVGLSFREIAGLLDLSERTVKRHWLFAKAWLQAEAAKRR